MKHSAARDRYFAQEVLPFAGNPEEPTRFIGVFADSGVHIRRHHLPGKPGGEPVEIAVIADIHFNYCDEVDEENEELMLTKQHRRWLGNASSVPAAVKAMELAVLCDQTVVVGDTLDYLSHGAMALTQTHIWDVDPQAILCLGGHELTRQMQTGQPDRTSPESRRTEVDAFWAHDTTYLSRIIGDKVMAVMLDNSSSRYAPGVAERLEADIQRARTEGLPIILFQHEPISTFNPADTAVKAVKVYDGDNRNFYQAMIGGECAPVQDEATLAVCRTIRENADVVRLVCCGHLHSGFYTEIAGVQQPIPQIVLEGNAYDNNSGHVLIVTVD